MQFCCRSWSTGQQWGSPQSWLLVAPGCCLETWGTTLAVQDLSKTHTSLWPSKGCCLLGQPQATEQFILKAESGLRLLSASRSHLVFWHNYTDSKGRLKLTVTYLGLRAALGSLQAANQGSISQGTLADIFHFSKGHFPRVVWGRRLPSLGLQWENFKGRKEHERRGCLVESSMYPKG